MCADGSVSGRRQVIPPRTGWMLVRRPLVRRVISKGWYSLARGGGARFDNIRKGVVDRRAGLDIGEPRHDWGNERGGHACRSWGSHVHQVGSGVYVCRSRV